MKIFTGKITINRPRDQVVDLFLDPNHQDQFQEGYERKEIISGDLNQVRCHSKVYFRIGHGTMTLDETILKNELPETFEAFYHHERMDNTMKVSFRSLNDQVTEYYYEYEYSRVQGLWARIMLKVFSAFYKKQGDLRAQRFKTFVEGQ